MAKMIRLNLASLTTKAAIKIKLHSFVYCLSLFFSLPVEWQGMRNAHQKVKQLYGAFIMCTKCTYQSICTCSTWLSIVFVHFIHVFLRARTKKIHARENCFIFICLCLFLLQNLCNENSRVVAHIGHKSIIQERLS